MLGTRICKPYRDVCGEVCDAVVGCVDLRSGYRVGRWDDLKNGAVLVKVGATLKPIILIGVASA